MIMLDHPISGNAYSVFTFNQSCIHGKERVPLLSFRPFEVDQSRPDMSLVEFEYIHVDRLLFPPLVSFACRSHVLDPRYYQT